MSAPMHAMAVDSFVMMLRNLLGILDKGEAHARAKGFDPAVLVSARLAPDMFPLSKQVQFVCQQAAECAARLTGKEAPRLDAGEETFEALRERIKRTIALVEEAPAAAFEGAEDREISVPLRDELVLELKGLAYLKDWAIPQFYFHLVTAYAILRHNGVDVGKPDYVAGLGSAIRRRGGGGTQA
ncbi:DUF1993 domain-containing protein [Sorangium sp. So ce1153]|uniref:DUF1993 domain-containing protein n=1 Tax=Sorangium sp. So ce1153 TaxID=3133333 RepID=UPI003F63F083